MRNNRTRARNNGRPAIKASSLPPHRMYLYPGQRPLLACPDCDAWPSLCRGQVLRPHNTSSGVRCPGSGQQFVMDLDVAEWGTAMRVAELDAAQVADLKGPHRSSPVQRTGKPPVPAAVTQIAARRVA